MIYCWAITVESKLSIGYWLLQQRETQIINIIVEFLYDY